MELPYYLPAHLEIHAKNDAINAHNDLPNSNTIDRSPNQLFFPGKLRPRNPIDPFLRFGAVCMIQSNPTTISKRASVFNTNQKYLLPTEVGVNLGTEEGHPYCYLFLIGNGHKIFRKKFHSFSADYIPFTFIAKPQELISIHSLQKVVDSAISTPAISSIPTQSLGEISNTPRYNTRSSRSHLSLFTQPSVYQLSRADYLPTVQYLTKNALLLHQDISNTDYKLTPPTVTKDELTVSEALKHPLAEFLTLAIQKEVNNLTVIVPALRHVQFSDIPLDAVIIPNKFFVKPKESSDLKWKARLAMGGDRQPANSFGNIYASMCDNNLSIFALSLAQADSIEKNYHLNVVGFDITTAFPKCAATKKLSP